MNHYKYSYCNIHFLKIIILAGVKIYPMVLRCTATILKDIDIVFTQMSHTHTLHTAVNVILLEWLEQWTSKDEWAIGDYKIWISESRNCHIGKFKEKTRCRVQILPHSDHWDVWDHIKLQQTHSTETQPEVSSEDNSILANVNSWFVCMWFKQTKMGSWSVFDYSGCLCACTVS